ncbi:hypothetical protein GCM10009754_84400 [Amycolatopsis minnesotensis]|uniref:Uncharacterized protein n=1 Tax=Amycolatopsis minnesotensis TaxID=337894 RepID=A0ABP5E6L0_9PSEU
MHRARIGIQACGEQLEQGRLATAVLAHDAEPDPGGDGDVDAGEHGPFAECDVQIGGVELRMRARG